MSPSDASVGLTPTARSLIGQLQRVKRGRQTPRTAPAGLARAMPSRRAAKAPISVRDGLPMLLPELFQVDKVTRSGCPDALWLPSTKV